MAGYINEDTRKVTTHRLIEMKQKGEKISMLTAYDYTMAQIVDGAGMDVILVGDSASNTMAGNVTTLPITLDQMIYHDHQAIETVLRILTKISDNAKNAHKPELDDLDKIIDFLRLFADKFHHVLRNLFQSVYPGQ